MRFSLVLFAVVSASCVTRGPESPYAPVYVTNRALYTLLPPGDIEAPMDTAQHITGTYGEGDFILDAWTEADETRVTMAFFNPLGVGMGDLSFDGEGLFFSSPFLPANLKAEYIVADFQFCFYRARAVEEALKQAMLSFTVENTADGREIRTILEGNTPIIRIEKGRSLVVYTNYLRRYAYTLEGEW